MMLNTIEEKLSAIMAINEEKQHVDELLDNRLDLKMLFQYRGNQIEIQTHVYNKLKTTLIEEYTLRKQELIAKAEELMK
jgi:hypothetical protein